MEANAAVDGTGNPIPTSAVLTASAKHIGIRCMSENMAFLKCKKNDPNPQKCLEKGRDVTRCVLGLLKDLHQRCPKEMDDYVGCMYYYTNEFDLCRKEQEAFEKAYTAWLVQNTFEPPEEMIAYWFFQVADDTAGFL